MKMTSVFMKSPVLDNFLRRDDVYIDLENIGSVNDEVAEDGSAIFLVYTKTEEVVNQFKSFLTTSHMYFGMDEIETGDTVFSILISEEDICTEEDGEESEGDEEVEESEVEESEVKESESDGEEIEGEGEEDDEEVEEEDDDDEEDEESDVEENCDEDNSNSRIRVCDENCKCINCLDELSEMLETTCESGCKCVNCLATL